MHAGGPCLPSGKTRVHKKRSSPNESSC
jgi:hypothetical protein